MEGRSVLELAAKFLGYLAGVVFTLVFIQVSLMVMLVMALSSMADRFEARVRKKRKLKSLEETA